MFNETITRMKDVLTDRAERRRVRRARREWVQEVVRRLEAIDDQREHVGWDTTMDARLAVLHEVGPAVYIDASRALVRRGRL